MPKASTFGLRTATQMIDSDTFPMLTNAGENVRLPVSEARSLVGPGWSATINAYNEDEATDELKIQAAISRAVSVGANRVFVPTSMLPYDASLITFNNAVQMVREGGNFSVYDVQAYGAAADGVTDDTQSIQEALDAADAFDVGIASVYVPDGKYAVLGTLTMGSGITFYGDTISAEYEEGFGGGALPYGALLYKPSAGTAGPIVVLEWTSAIHHLNFKHLKSGGATTGIIRMGPTSATTIITNCNVSEVHMIGLRTGDVDGTTTCYGIYFPDSNVGYARYFNHFHNIHVTECDVAWRLGEQANGNNFSNITTRECHLHWDLDGGTSTYCIENNFTAISAFSINILVPAPIVFRLRNGSSRNNFVPYISETFGTAFDIDASSVNNRFLGTSNETNSSYVHEGNDDLSYAQEINTRKRSQMLLPTTTTGTRNIFGRGNKMTFFSPVTGTLPQMANNAGTLVASDADNKKIIQFPSAYTKASNITFHATLRVSAYAPNNHGMHTAEVKFNYRNQNQTTNAGELSVEEVKRHNAPQGFEISGLWFLTGVAAGGNFAIALVGGNKGATEFDTVTVELDLAVITYSTNTVDMDALSDLTFATADVTANDVTDGISLLTVADTAV